LSWAVTIRGRMVTSLSSEVAKSAQILLHFIFCTNSVRTEYV
jgi:hypothetical protein